MDELFESGTGAVLAHSVMNKLTLIRAAARMLENGADHLTAPTRQELTEAMRHSIADCLDLLGVLMRFPPSARPPEVRRDSGV